MRSHLFRTEPNPTTQSSVVAVRDLDGATPVTLSVECATYPSTTVNDNAPNAGLVYISKVLTPVRLAYQIFFQDPNSPLTVTTWENDGVYFIDVRLAKVGGGIVSTAREVRNAILYHRFDPAVFAKIEDLPLSFKAPDAGQLVSVELLAGDTGSGVVTEVLAFGAGSFLLGTDPDATTSAPSSGFPSTGAAVVEFSPTPTDVVTKERARVRLGMTADAWRRIA